MTVASADENDPPTSDPRQQQQDKQKDQEHLVPVKWRRLIKLLEDHGWTKERISGSRHVFTKPGQPCIPLSFVGANVSKRFAKQVLQQAGISVEGQNKHLTFNLSDDNEENDEKEHTVVDEIPRRQSRIHDGATSSKPGRHAKPIPKSKELTKRTATDEFEGAMRAKHDQDLAQEVSKKQQRRVDALRRVQEQITAGNYRIALSFIKQETIDISSTMTQDCDVDANMVFFEIFAQSELAFQYPFDSELQRSTIVQMLKRCIEHMEAKSDTRFAVHKLAVYLQKRVFKLYSDHGSELFRKAGEDSRNVSEDSIDDFMQTLDQALGCLCFVADLSQLLQEQPFIAEAASELSRQFPFAELLEPSIYHMCCAFYQGQYESAEKTASTLLFVADKFRNEIEDDLAASESWCSLPSSRQVSPDLAKRIATYVKSLVPAFTKREVWKDSRPFCTDFDTMTNQYCCSMSDALTFADMVLEAIKKTPKESIRHLAESWLTRDFMYRSWMYATHALYSSSVSLSSPQRNATTYQDRQRVDRLLFDGCQGDSRVRESVLVLDRLQKLSEIYDNYYDYKKEPSVKKARFDWINAARRASAYLITPYTTDGCSRATLAQHVARLQHDLDMSALWTPETASTCGWVYEPTQPPIKTGNVFFSAKFQFELPFFLSPFLLEHECKRLLVIDAFGANQWTLAYADHIGKDRFESLAFEMISELLKLGGNSVSHSTMRGCIVKNNEHEREVKKYRRMINRLSAGVFDQKEKLVEMLQKRESAAASLMGKLESCVLKHRQLPADFVKKIETYRNLDLPVHLTTQQEDLIQQQWTDEDARDISRSMRILDDVGQHATSFMQIFTHQLYPVGPECPWE